MKTSSLGWLVVALLGAGCTVRNPDARLDFQTAPNDLATAATPPDLGPANDLAPSGVQLTNGGLLESVAPDQQYVAFLPSLTPGPQPTGSLTVMPLPSGPRTHVADGAYGAGFAGGDTLFYSLAPAPSTDAGTSAIYGKLGVWLPGLAAGVTLSTGYAVARAFVGDGSFAVWWDAAAPSTAGTGDVKLARASDCSAAGCAPVTVAAGVAHPASLTVTSGHAAYAIRRGATYDVWLVDVAAGVSTRVASGGGSGGISFSSDGALLAMVAPDGLQVVSTANGSPVAWGALPAGAKVHSVAFADATTLAVRATPAGASSDSAYVTTAASVAPVASGISGIFVARSGASGTTRWLLCAGPVNAAGVGPVAAYDLTAQTPTAIALATATSPALVTISYDQLYARLLEGYDAGAATGTLTLVKLPDGNKTTLGNGVVGASAATFIGQHGVIWIGAGGRLTEWRDDVVTTYADGVQDFRTRGSTVYFTVESRDGVHGYVPGIWFTALD